MLSTTIPAVSVFAGARRQAVIEAIQGSWNDQRTHCHATFNGISVDISANHNCPDLWSWLVTEDSADPVLVAGGDACLRSIAEVCCAAAVILMAG